MAKPLIGSATTIFNPTLSGRRFALWPLLFIALLVIILHLCCIDQYGFFRDELYFWACSQKLDFGYVDHPPLSVALLKGWESLFSDSLTSIRMLSAMIGAGIVLVIGRITFELGGKFWAQVLAGLAILASPVHQVVSHLYSMNGLDILLWAIATLFVIRVQKTGSWHNWIWLGITLGFGLQNKLSVLWLILGIFFALILTKHRKHLKTPQPYVSLTIALAIWTPFIIWQFQNGWPTLEFIRNANDLKLQKLAPWEFIGTQIIVTNPAIACLWIIGLIYAWKVPKYRTLALIFSTTFMILLLNGRSRENYLTPAFATIIPLGAMVVAEWFTKKQKIWVPFVVIISVGVLLVPLGIPILPPKLVVSVAETSPIKPPSVQEGATSPMQGHADMFGWKEITKGVEIEYKSLPAKLKSKTLIYATNYGEASAILRLGNGLPPVISPHNNFALWGFGDYDGTSILVVGQVPDSFKNKFKHFRILGYYGHPYSVPEAVHTPISLATGLKSTPEQFWQEVTYFE